MNAIVIKPSRLNGRICAPPSKSMSHRAIICAGLSNGESKVEHVILSKDIKASIDAMRSLGASIEIRGDEYDSTLIIQGSRKTIEEAVINCKESGSTLRFMIPVAMMISEKCTFTGSGRLVERPLDVFYRIFEKDSIVYETKKGLLPLKISGKLKGGNYGITGTVSSQFISGLFFALPLLERDSTIEIIDRMESKGYIDLTLSMLEKFGIKIENNNYMNFKIKGGSKYKNTNYRVEGDYSQAAFFIVAKEIGNYVDCFNLNEDSMQGDKEITKIVKLYDGRDKVTIDASQIPDLVPIIAVLASLKEGVTTHIRNAGRLRIKESDRLKAIRSELSKIGANIEEQEEGLCIRGKSELQGAASVDSWNDHRIAMALAIAATCCREEITLNGYMAVAKSYPNFWDEYRKLGGELYELNDR